MNRQVPPILSRLLPVVVALIVAITFGLANMRAQNQQGQNQQNQNQNGQGPESYTVGLFGDMPYGALGRSQYPALLADINRAQVAFSVYDGDLKAGGDPGCTDSLYATAIQNFNTLERPLIWVPGDNDWTDCWGRYGIGSKPWFDPIDRLNLERSLFAATDQSLGKKTLTLQRQSSEGGLYALYKENIRWRKGPVVYLGLNVQGSNDNYPYQDTDLENATAPDRGDAERQVQRDEEVARRAANFAWLDEGFAYAAQVGAKGIMIVWQADPNFNNEQHQTNPHEWDAFPPYVDKLQKLTENFPGQVALVHGDSHYFKVDKPLNHSTGFNGNSPGVLTNFTRVETFGSRNTHWVLATIDPNNPNVFSFDQRIVPGNTR